MTERKSLRKKKITITIYEWVLNAIDDLAGDVGTFRSDIIEALCGYCFDHEEIVNGLFPFKEEGEEEEENQDEYEES